MSEASADNNDNFSGNELDPKANAQKRLHMNEKKYFDSGEYYSQAVKDGEVHPPKLKKEEKKDEA